MGGPRTRLAPDSRAYRVEVLIWNERKEKEHVERRGEKDNQPVGPPQEKARTKEKREGGGAGSPPYRKEEGLDC